MPGATLQRLEDRYPLINPLPDHQGIVRLDGVAKRGVESGGF
jgi:hypothetical protein